MIDKMIDLEKVYHNNFPKAVSKMPAFITEFAIKTLQKIFHEETFNNLNAKNHYMQGLAYVDHMVENVNISYTVKPSEVKNIPSSGKLIVVSNHTTSADAFALVQLIGQHRDNKKVKLLVNSVFMGITDRTELIIPVDNINGSITKESIKAMNSALENDEVIVIFPAGIVNRLSLSGLKDTPWKASFLKIAKRNQAPVLPVRIKARNSILFYFVSLILPMKFSALMLPHEFATTGEKKPLAFNIGKVIPAKSFSDKNITIDKYLDMFREHIYTIGTNKKPILDTETTIAAPQNKLLLKKEVLSSQLLGRTLDGKLIILADQENAPFLVQELGRVREISFRAIGGGTGTAKDNDLYDVYYKHIVLWDEVDLEIVGAYRVGEVTEIVKTKGREGLYTHNQYQFMDEFNKFSHNAVELGRSFIQPKYWGSRALDNLWQGIGAYLHNYPDVNYTYGIVTINAETPQKAVAAIVYFYAYNFSCKYDMITSKNPYVLSDVDRVEFEALFKDLTYKEGFVVLKKYLKDLGAVVPTLFKQYAELYDEGAVKYFDFSVNESLHGVVEAFILADVSKMKEKKRMRYIRPASLERRSAKKTLA